MQELKILKALADGNRLRVVRGLARHPELCACQITEWLGVSGATASRHLAILQAAGLVCGVKEGRWIYYSLSPDFPAALRDWLLRADGDAGRLDSIVKINPSELCRKQALNRSLT